MEIVQISTAIEDPPEQTEAVGLEMLKRIERAGRTCYKSEDRITDDSAPKFVKMLIDRGHHSVLEHVSLTVRFIVPRGISHELVRHRLASYSQESTRYCNYSGGVQFVRPWHLEPGSLDEEFWLMHAEGREDAYLSALALGWTPQMARGLLPIDLKTEVVMTANAREWRHFFSLRAAKPAHPQMQEAACDLLRRFRVFVPVLFDDVGDVSVFGDTMAALGLAELLSCLRKAGMP